MADSEAVFVYQFETDQIPLFHYDLLELRISCTNYVQLQVTTNEPYISENYGEEFRLLIHKTPVAVWAVGLNIGIIQVTIEIWCRICADASIPFLFRDGLTVLADGSSATRDAFHLRAARDLGCRGVVLPDGLENHNMYYKYGAGLHPPWDVIDRDALTSTVEDAYLISNLESAENWLPNQLVGDLGEVTDVIPPGLKRKKTVKRQFLKTRQPFRSCLLKIVN